MTRRPHARYLLAALTAGVLTACGGGDVGVGESAAEAGISPERETGGGPAFAAGTGSDVDDEDGGSPGGPGGEPEGNGSEAGEPQGNPGAPGDVAVFEEAGVTFETLRTGSAQIVCVEQGLCTLASPVVVAGDPDDLGGVDQCLIREQSDITYHPPARSGRFLEGATVTAHVDCTDPDAAEGAETGEPEGSEESGEPGGSGDTGVEPGGTGSDETGSDETGADITEGTGDTGDTGDTGVTGDDATGDPGTGDQSHE